MWQKVATEMGIPWRSAESMHWQLGEKEMSARANAPMFQLHPLATFGSMDAESTIRPGDVFLQYQPPRQTLAKTNPSGVPIVSAPDTKLTMKDKGGIRPLDDLLEEGVQRRW